MRKTSNKFVLASVILCTIAIMLSIWAIGYIGIQPGRITGDVQGTVGVTVATVCGDGICSYPSEDYNNCPADCTGYCGDAVCDPTESTATCCTDCGCSSGYTCTANVCVEVAAPAVTPGMPNVGGTSPTGPAQKASFSIDTDVIKAVLTPGQTTEEKFEIKNDGGVPLNIFLRVKGLNNNLRLSNTELYLEPNVAATVKAIFYAYEDDSEDIYTGKIIITADNPLMKEIAVVLEIQSAGPLFDVGIFLPERFRKIYAGQAIEPQITIFDISKTGQSDVHVYYEIKDSNNDVVLSEDEVVNVRSQLTYTKTFLLPSELEPGDYVLAVRAEYAGTVGTASEVFSIVDKQVVFSTSTLLYLATMLSFLAVILYIIYRKKIK